jgi:hypothetical protein
MPIFCPLGVLSTTERCQFIKDAVDMLGLHSHVNFWLAMVVFCIVYANNLFLPHSSRILSTDYLYTCLSQQQRLLWWT